MHGNRRWRRLALACTAIVAGATGWVAEANALPAGCGELILDDPLSGATLGDQQGGTLDASGFTPGTGSIVWPLPALHHGCIQMTVDGMVTAGVGEHDLLELFTGPDGSFSDGNTDYFLLFKIAGDVFPEYEGRLKVEMGLEYSAREVGTWSENLTWSDPQAYDLVVQLDGAGVATFYRDDIELGSVDYNSINGGTFDFESLRIPNDGNYQWQAALQNLSIRDVRVYDAAPPPAGSSGGADTGVGDTTGSGGAGTGPDATTTSGLPPGDTGPGGDTLDTTAGSGESAGGGLPGLTSGGRGGDDGGCSCHPSGPTAPGWALLLLVLAARRRRVSA